ncbi:GAF domain-containing sensor histidine kinase [Niastella vici]|nr:GAF domain-containing sensor histidine kinase [Niastella vici]
MQLNEAKKKIELIRAVTLDLNKMVSLQEKLYNILKILHDQFFINYSMILLPGPESKYLTVQAHYGYETDYKGISIPMGSGIAGLAALKKIPINITGIRRKRLYLNIASQGAQAALPQSPGLDDPESQIAIPLVSNNELVAVLLAESYNISVFNKEDEAFLITLSQSIAVSIQNSILFDTMENVIAKRTEELERSNKTKDRLFSLISHDLRGPITSFHNIARLVSHYNRQNEKEKIEQLSHRIDQSVDKLNVLLDNLLNWALAQTKELQCRPERLNIITLLTEVMEMFGDHLALKNISLCTMQGSCLHIEGDYHMLSAVFRNLLSNAIKYTPRNGQILVNIHSDNAHALVEIHDTGIGIPAEKLGAIFMPDEKKSTRGTDNEKGTGLGLLVVHEFVQLNQGFIRIESEPQQGTKVTVGLPLK